LPEKSNLGIDLEKNRFRQGAVSTFPSRISDGPTRWHLTLPCGDLWRFVLCQSIQSRPSRKEAQWPGVSQNLRWASTRSQ
jgi:hypothetical protein